MKTLSLLAPAKVNLTLAVGAPLPENGYHPIASWMVTLDFGDDVILTKQMFAADEGGDPVSSTNCGSRFDIRFDADAPKPQPIDWPLEKDLAYRAHGLLEQHTNQTLPVEVIVNKRIPAGAGLAGGSADAAAVFVGMNRLFELGLSLAELSELSMQLGSDIAFLVAAMHDESEHASSAALVTGLGEMITPVPAQRLHLVLIFPPFGCPTGPVYQTFDTTLTDPKRQPDVERVQSLIARTPPSNEALFNDLAEPACIVQPRLAELRQQLADLVQQPIHVSGSGSTLFTLADSSSQAESMTRVITETTGLPTRNVRG